MLLIVNNHGISSTCTTIQQSNERILTPVTMLITVNFYGKKTKQFYTLNRSEF